MECHKTFCFFCGGVETRIKTRKYETKTDTEAAVGVALHSYPGVRPNDISDIGVMLIQQDG